VLYIERLRELYSSTNINRVIESRKIKGVGHAAGMGKKINAYKVLAGKHAGKRLLGRYRRTLEDNIKTDDRH